MIHMEWFMLPLAGKLGRLPEPRIDLTFAQISSGPCSVPARHFAKSIANMPMNH